MGQDSPSSWGRLICQTHTGRMCSQTVSFGSRSRRWATGGGWKQTAGEDLQLHTLSWREQVYIVLSILKQSLTIIEAVTDHLQVVLEQHPCLAPCSSSITSGRVKLPKLSAAILVCCWRLAMHMLPVTSAQHLCTMTSLSQKGFQMEKPEMCFPRWPTNCWMPYLKRLMIQSSFAWAPP